MNDGATWKLLDRKLAYDSKFLKVYEDKVELPNGSVIDDYTVVEKPSIVMVVATNSDNRVVILNEYKYAAGEYLFALPAGHKKKDETTVEAAKRELAEETGYTSEEVEEVGVLREYPTKDLHSVYVIRAKNIKQSATQAHEETESITHNLVTVAELKTQIRNHEWKASSALAALTFSGILF